MTRVLRLVLGALLAIVVVAGAVVAYVALTFSPKDYLPVLTAGVKDATGRELRSDGRIGLKLFPCCAITLGETSLGNPPGFPAGDFARVRSAAVSLKLWPLITRRAVQLGTVRLDGLAVELRERPDGSTTWDFSAGRSPAAKPAGQDASTGGTADTLAVRAVDIRDATVHYRSEKSGADYLVENLNLSTGDMTQGGPTRLDADLRLTSIARKLSASLKFSTRFTAGGEGGALSVSQPRLEVHVSGAGLPSATLQATFSAPDISISRGETTQVLFRKFDGEFELPGWKSPQADLSGSFTIEGLHAALGTATTLDVPVVNAALHAEGKGIPGQVIDAKLSAGKIAGDVAHALASVDALEATIHGLGASFSVTGRGRVGGDTGTQLAGRLRIEPVSPRSLLAVFNQGPPATSDPQALTRLSGTANWLLQPAFAGLGALDLQLDKTHIGGSVRLPRTEGSALAFDLHLSALDADRYRSGEAAPTAGGKPLAEPQVQELPLEAIRALRMDGRLQIDELIFAKVRLKNLGTRVHADSGRLHLDPLTAGLYGGTLAGRFTIDATGPGARVVVDQRLSALKVGPALRDVYKSDALDGDLSATLAVSANGRTTKDLWRSLAGPVSVHLDHGTYRGADLWYEIRRARALLKREAPPVKPADAATPIDSLTLEGTAAAGVLRTTRFSGKMPFIDLSGQGAFDLVANTLDCRLKAQVVQTPQFADGSNLAELTGFGIPLTLKGPMAAPKVGVDFGNLAKSIVTEKVERKVKEKLLKKFGDFLGR
jgi:AsmA protein